MDLFGFTISSQFSPMHCECLMHCGRRQTRYVQEIFCNIFFFFQYSSGLSNVTLGTKIIKKSHVPTI